MYCNDGNVVCNAFSPRTWAPSLLSALLSNDQRWNRKLTSITGSSSYHFLYSSFPSSGTPSMALFQTGSESSHSYSGRILDHSSSLSDPIGSVVSLSLTTVHKTSIMNNIWWWSVSLIGIYEVGGEARGPREGRLELDNASSWTLWLLVGSRAMWPTPPAGSDNYTGYDHASVSIGI